MNTEPTPNTEAKPTLRPRGLLFRMAEAMRMARRKRVVGILREHGYREIADALETRDMDDMSFGWGWTRVLEAPMPVEEIADSISAFADEIKAEIVKEDAYALEHGQSKADKGDAQ